MPPVEEVSVERVAGVLSPAEDRMIVRAGDMSLVVDDVPLTLDRITELADG
jgi:hypothetical protein